MDSLIDKLNFSRVTRWRLAWDIDVTPIFQELYGEEIIKSAILEINDNVGMEKTSDVENYCEVLLEMFKKRPHYLNFPHDYTLHIIFSNYKEVFIDSDYNGLYFYRA